MEYNFNDLKKKDVISVKSGKKLGKINDISFSYPEGCVCNLTINNNALCVFSQNNKIKISLCNIKTIGDDVILVEYDN